MNDFTKEILIAAVIAGAVTLAVWLYVRLDRYRVDVPVSVNYHYTRTCNFECGFCFHTARTSYVLPLDQAKRGIELLKAAGMRKLNFAGGEPLLDKEFLGALIVHAKSIGVESVSIVTNGSLLTRKFLADYGSCIDVLAVSCDSFDKEVNKQIGRKSGNPMPRLAMISKWCKEFSIRFKINTVVNAFNVHEDMNRNIAALDPFRWKCFQVLIDESENTGTSDQLRNAGPYLISKEQYNAFLARHSSQKSLVPEPNELMRSSYLILDEYMRFLSKEGSYDISDSILDVGVAEAMKSVVWNQSSFRARGGIYEWSGLDW